MGASTTSHLRGSLIDSNLLIAFLRGEQGVRDRLDRSGAIWMSATSVGELYYGAAYSGSPGRNAARVTQLVQLGQVFDCDSETALIYGDLKAELRKRGRLIPDNDIWIASTAVQHGLVLATRDAHFAVVPGLVVEKW